MRQAWSERVKGAVRPVLSRALHPFGEVYRCPICGYRGPMKSKRMSRSPSIVRRHSKCPRCASVERHRLQSLALDELLPGFDAGRKSMLHVAPERCLQERLRRAFGTYHTCDLFRRDVDFNEDVQRMSFPDASYDAVFISRVLSIPPDLEASLSELRRILRPGGVAIISEYLDRETTEPDDDPHTEAARFFGVDILDELRERFDRVETFSSEQRPGEFQLVNLLVKDGQPMDDVPELVREPGRGVREILILAYVDSSEASSS